MRNCCVRSCGRVRFHYVLVLSFALTAWVSCISAQTASTGALAGVVLDPGNAAIPKVEVRLINQQTAEEKSAVSDEQGSFAFQFLSPGIYELRASKAPFHSLQELTVGVPVTETVRVELHLRLETMAQTVNVSSEVLMVQTDNSALGRIVGTSTVTALPLVTRNYTEIAVLSPGVSAGVCNAGERGSGGMPLSQISGSSDGIFVHGARSYDNNYQLDGLSVNDVQGSGSSSGGIPIPNPETIAEFKVQTGLYDATQLLIGYVNNGRDLMVDSMKNGRGLGLVSMAERIHLLNGSISIDSKPNAGTTIRASVPLAVQTTVLAASAN